MDTPHDESPGVIDTIDFDIVSLIGRDEHVLIAPGIISRAPECALYGCVAFGHAAVVVHEAPAWFCEAHLMDILERRTIWPYAPV
ncbi:MAG: hypothetical protein U0360_03960 [Dehalococcoidia bacterium]